MVASVDSDDSSTSTGLPTLVTSTPSPASTNDKNDKITRRKKRISYQHSHNNTTNNAPASHELFGDYMSIEEIAAQTEKASQSRDSVVALSRSESDETDGASPVASPSQFSYGEGGALCKPVSKKASVLKGAVLVLFGLAIVLPFLLFRNNVQENVDPIRASSELTREHEMKPSAGLANSEILNIAATDSASLSDPEVEIVRDKIKSTNQNDAVKNDSFSHTVRDKSTDGKDSRDKSFGNNSQPNKPGGDLKTVKQETNTALDHEVSLKEAFNMISASRSTSATEKAIDIAHAAETLCRKIISDSKKMAPHLSSDETPNSFNKTKYLDTSNPWEIIYFQSSLCIGGVKMSISFNNTDTMLQEAKQVFEHLSGLDPYNLEAQAGLGTSILAQGILFNVNNSTSRKKSAKEQVSLLNLATYHLTLASSLITTTQKSVNRAEKLSTIETKSTVPNTGITIQEQLSHITHAAILHNLALAYIAQGDSNSYTPLLLRAAAIHRQAGSNEQNFFWNLPDKVMQVVEEKAWTIGTSNSKGKKKQWRKRRMPFLPQFAFDEIIDGILI